MTVHQAKGLEFDFVFNKSSVHHSPYKQQPNPAARATTRGRRLVPRVTIEPEGIPNSNQQLNQRCAMSTDRQIAANRQNAQHSTGPTTPEGRAAVRLNGLKHGLCAETIVVPGEDPAEFEAMLDAYRAEYQPATPSAEFLLRQVAIADWRLLRLHRLEASFHTIRHKQLELTPPVQDIHSHNDGPL